MVQPQETKKVKVTMGQVKKISQENHKEQEKTAFSLLEEQKQKVISKEQNTESKITDQGQIQNSNLINQKEQEQLMTQGEVHPMMNGMMYPYPGYGKNLDFF